ncbi:calcium ion binding protein [Aureococcus anophagefferens]|nr:calcium ion binding protein [Aureococcus anophagefferens]
MLALLGLVTVAAASFPAEFRNATHIASVFADLDAPKFLPARAHAAAPALDAVVAFLRGDAVDVRGTAAPRCRRTSTPAPRSRATRACPSSRASRSSPPPPPNAEDAGLPGAVADYDAGDTVHVYASAPGASALANHTDTADVLVHQDLAPRDPADVDANALVESPLFGARAVALELEEAPEEWAGYCEDRGWVNVAAVLRAEGVAHAALRFATDTAPPPPPPPARAATLAFGAPRDQRRAPVAAAAVEQGGGTASTLWLDAARRARRGARRRFAASTAAPRAPRGRGAVGRPQATLAALEACAAAAPSLSLAVDAAGALGDVAVHVEFAARRAADRRPRARGLAAAAAAAAPPGARTSALGASVTLDRSGRVAAAASLVSAKFAEDERRRLCGINEDSTVARGLLQRHRLLQRPLLRRRLRRRLLVGLRRLVRRELRQLLRLHRGAAGTANPYTGRTSCTSCVAGKYQPSAGQTTCADCWEGSYSAAGATTCASCPAGTYARRRRLVLHFLPRGHLLAAGATSCTSCAAGTYASASGSSSCAVCPGGQYQGSTGASSCSNCAAGKYLADSASAADHDSSGDCAVCAGGSYQNTAGSTSCASCPAGTYNDDFGAYSTNHDALDDCAICAAGTYVTGSGATACASCPAGTYLPSNYGNAAYVDEAARPARRRVRGRGSTGCASCAEGAAAAECVVCPGGQYRVEFDCVACPECTFGVERLLECDDCPEGRYADEAGLSTCHAAAPGYFPTDLASDADGYGPGGATNCAEVPAGSYASASSTDADGVGVTAGAAYANPCPAGTYPPRARTLRALLAGHLQPAGASSCVSCPAGAYGDASGHHSAACGGACAAGRYGASGALTSDCSGPCPAGYRCPAGTAIAAPTAQRAYGLEGCAVHDGTVYFSDYGGGALYKASVHDASTVEFVAQVADPSDGAEACYVRLPSGCGSVLSETTTPAEWRNGPAEYLRGIAYDAVYGYVYAAVVSGASGVYRFDASTGAVELQVELDAPLGVAISDDGATLYVGSSDFHAPIVRAGAVSAGGLGALSEVFNAGAGNPVTGLAVAGSTLYYAAAGSVLTHDLDGGAASTVLAGRFEHLAVASGTLYAATVVDLASGAATTFAAPVAGYGVCADAEHDVFYGAAKGDALGVFDFDGSSFHAFLRGYEACGDGAASYCPESTGSESLAALDGEYTTPASGDGRSRRTVGSYCAGGENVPCPAGTYGVEPGLSDAACSGACDAGYFCAAGSTSPTAALCGQYVDPPQAAYCPAGAGHPMPAPVGFATTPLWGSIYARTGVVHGYCGDGDRAPLVAVACPSSVEVDEKTSGDVVATATATHAGDGSLSATFARTRGGPLTSRFAAAYEDFEAAHSAAARRRVLTHLCVVVSEEGVSIAVDGTFVAQTRSSVGASLSVVSLSVGLSGAFSFAGHVDDVALFGAASCLRGRAGELRRAVESGDCSAYDGVLSVSSDGAASSAVEVDALHCDSYYTTIKATTAATGVFAPGAGYCTFRVDVIDANDAASIFSIEGGCGDNDLGYFGIEACSGQVYTKTTAFNALETASYEICVTVTDDGEPPLSDVATVYVTILNVNGAPEFSADSTQVECSVEENAAPGTALSCDLSAADEDGDALTYALSDPHGILSLPDAAAPSLATAVVLDYEAASTYVGVQFSTSDGELEDLVYVAVAVTDVNDAPVWDGATSFAVDEHSAVGTVVGSVAAYASDEDGDALTFSMTVAPSSSLGEFSMSSDGEITVSSNAGLDYEAYAEDHDDDAPTWVATLVANHNAPSVALVVPENTPVGAVLALADGGSYGLDDDVYEPDDGQGHVYDLLDFGDGASPETRFSVDADTSEISTNVVFDYEDAETGNFVFVRARATDDGSPALSSDEVTLCVSVLTANDGELGSGDATLTITVLDRGVAPVIAADQHFTIPENSAAGVAVGTLIATDERRRRARLLYCGRLGANLFDVGEADGAIAVAEDAALDFETQASYALEVTVTDGFATTYATVGITLSDVNEAPTFPASAVDLAVTEAAAAGAQAGQYVYGADEDAGDVVTYSFALDGGSASPFAIDAVGDGTNWGLLSVVDAAALDYETTASYTGTVTATDSAGLTATAFVGIGILDVNEPPSFAASFLNLGSVVENGGFQLVGPLGATDPENDVLDFVLDDAAAAVFEVRDGSLYVRDDGLDFESSSEWSVSVTATESATSEAYAASLDVAVSVVDANDLSIDAASASVLPTRGGPFAIVFTGSNVGPWTDGLRRDEPGSEVTCSAVDEGVGRSHVWNVTVSSPGSPAFSALSTFETAYEAPAVAATAADGPLPTAGGGLVTLTGSGFAPYCGTFCADGLRLRRRLRRPREPCDAEPYDGGACQALLEGAAAITFGRSAALVAEFSCGDVAVTTPGALAVGAETTLTCVAGEGYGEAKFWALTVGVAAASSFFARRPTPEDAAGIVYAPPSISSVAIGGVESSQALRTAGGETLEIFGENFGPAGAGLADVSVAYANGIYAHEAAGCYVAVSHTVIICETAPGVGSHYAFVATRAGLSSHPSDSTASYGPPVVDAASGGGLNEAATVGGDTFYLEGDNLGPAGSEVFVSYGPASRPDLYAAAACGVVVAHAKLSCETATGTGGVVRATVGNQTSAAYDANLTYAAPFVSYYESSWASDEDRVGAFAEGGEQLKLHGGNFGPLGNASLDSVSYLAADDDERYVACDVDGALGGVVGGDSPCLCAITTAHETVTCRTVAATGRGHSWHVVVDGQTSTTPTTRVEPPRVLGLLGNATNASIAGQDKGDSTSIAGGEAVAIVGANFGRLQRKLDYVRYGPSGDEYEATNCTLASDSRVACLTAPGVGVDLRVTVAVDGQASDVSPPLLSYARPRIFGVSPKSGDTAGGSVHVVNGTNLGLAFARTYVQIVFDGAVVPLDGASLTRASPGASGYSYSCGAAECVEFTPDPAGYRTSGLDDDEAPAVSSLIGYYFSDSAASTRVLVGGVEANVINAGAVVDPSTFTSTLVIQGRTVRRVDYEIPPGAGKANDVVLYANGRPSYSANLTEDVLYVRYRAPEVAASSPGLVPTYGGSVTLAGDNFGAAAADATVTLGGVVCEATAWTHDEVTVSVPAGAGDGKLVVEVAGQAATVAPGDNGAVAYEPPTLDAVSPAELPTLGGSVTVTGANLGAPGVAAVGLGTATTTSLAVVASDDEQHAWVTLAVEPGQGLNSLVFNVSGQFASIPLAFRASTLETLTPSAAKTTGGTALALNGSDFGIGSNVNVEFCCGWSSAGPTAVGLLSPTGQAEGPLTVTLSACADIGDPATCVASREPASFNFSKPTIHYLATSDYTRSPLADACFDDEGERVCVEAACDRFSEGGCGLETAGGYEIAIVGANFGIEKPRRLRRRRGRRRRREAAFRRGVDARAALLHRAAGRRRGAVSVAVGDFVSPPRAFSYDPPYVSRIAYPNPNAAGDRIQFSGKNFGETEALAGDNDEPYLHCESAPSTVGPQSLYIHVAGQNVSFPEADEKITMVCAADYYGQTALAAHETDFGCADDEFCAEKPVGSVVDHSNAGEPYSLAGYFRLDKRDDDAIPCDAWHAHRDTYCYELRPCSPSGACAGNNTCDAGYTDTMCAKCCDVSMAYLDDGKTKNPECWDGGDQLLYYRAYGECVECPTNYAPRRPADVRRARLRLRGLHVKKKRVDVAVVAIGVDYAQVLSVFATTEIEWPSELQRLYSSLAIFSFDFLDVFPPECSISVEYDVQWLAIQFGPLGLAAAARARLFRRSYLVWKYAHKKKEMFKRMRRLKGMITSTLLYGFYFIYLYMCENTLDPLNCQRIAAEDGATETKREYLSSEPNEVCWQEGEMQYSLVPIAVVFVFLLRCQGRGRYEEGLTEYLDDVSLTRARLGMLYYRFKPDVPYWILFVVLRKMCMACITLLFHSSASFQLAMLLMVLFTSCVFQMKYLPYLSSSNHDEIFTKYADRIKILHDEELSSAAAKDKAIRMARGKAVGKLTFASMTTRELRDSAAKKLFFEYNTVEGVLLVCSVLVCLVGVMLDSDYVADGRHAYTRKCLTYVTIFVISFSGLYFGAVLWQEIVTHIFPSLSCSCFSVFADGETREKDDDEIFDDGIEMAAGNPHLQKKMDDLMKDDQQLLSIKEQVEIKKLVGKLQTECRNLKRELADAKASSPRAAVPVKKKKVVGGIAHDPAPVHAAVDMDDEAVSPRRPSGFAGASNPLRAGAAKKATQPAKKRLG